jgi:hypothetical protein
VCQINVCKLRLQQADFVDIASLICVALAMQAGATGETAAAVTSLGWMPAVVARVDLLLCYFLDEGVIVTVAAVPEGALLYICR